VSHETKSRNFVSHDPQSSKSVSDQKKSPTPIFLLDEQHQFLIGFIALECQWVAAILPEQQAAAW
jgi:hypothetical protein